MLATVKARLQIKIKDASILELHARHFLRTLWFPAVVHQHWYCLSKGRLE